MTEKHMKQFYDIEKKYVDMSNKRIKTFKDAPSLF